MMSNEMELNDKQSAPGSKQTVMDKELKKLRRLLKLYFQPAFTMNGKTFTIHVLYCLLLMINIAELSLITYQMFRFGNERGDFSSAIKKETIGLRNLILKGWDADWETLPYPPAQGEFAVYDKQSLLEMIKHAVLHINTLETDALGFFKTNRDSIGAPINLTYEHFTFNWDWQKPDDIQKLDTQVQTFEIDYSLLTYDPETYTPIDYNLMDDLKNNEIYDELILFLTITLSFEIESIKFYTDLNKVLCMNNIVKIIFSDPDNTGQAIVSLETETEKKSCNGYEEWSLQAVTIDVGMVVIVVCSIGLFLTLCSFVFGILVLMKTKSFMRKYSNAYFQPDDPTETDLPNEEYFRFVSIWNICIIISEVFTLVGTSLIIFKDEKGSLGLDDLDFDIILLGIGCFFAWLSVLRVVKCHKRFQLLLSTVRAAAGDVLAYLLCVLILFVGYFVTGYVVLGPYNIKFNSPINSLETLSALINGDEIFTTLNIMECEKYGMIWWFSRVYIWSYVAVLTIIVLNLFIAIIMSAYEIIKDKTNQRDEGDELGSPEKVIKDFIEFPKENEFRKALLALMSSSHANDSTEERNMKKFLCKICHVSSDGKQVVLIKQRTLKALMGEEKEERSFRCCGIDFALIFVLRQVEGKYEVEENTKC